MNRKEIEKALEYVHNAGWFEGRPYVLNLLLHEIEVQERRILQRKSNREE